MQQEDKAASKQSSIPEGLCAAGSAAAPSSGRMAPDCASLVFPRWCAGELDTVDHGGIKPRRPQLRQRKLAVAGLTARRAIPRQLQRRVPSPY
mmetsp:Transcript_45535/g.101805  ORF Transcript_45535/g.101805 Transcript_45535/m.101805 type:complete len:93 (-) Transcript_45535:21-299(-)